jgi:threonine aldolase
MYSFTNDYSEAAAPQVMQALQQLSLNQYPGYGCDDVCASARKAIQDKLGNDKADIHFLEGGTQTNAVMIASMLKPWESVIAATSGHINVHETGAIEATGHKVETVPSINGLVQAADIDAIMKDRMPDHVTRPAAVYVSDSTEEGTIYTKAQLQSLRQVCNAHHLYLYLDGARLGSALTATGNDLTLADLAQLCDAFYIGGTKNGALFGEAAVIINDQLKPYFRCLMKQRGAMLAKGFVLGAQFKALFTDDLFFKLAANANQQAQYLKTELSKHGIQFLNDSPTNQIFPILNQQQCDKIKDFGYEVWGHKGNETIVRLVCSWATTKQAVDQLLARL